MQEFSGAFVFNVCDIVQVISTSHILQSTIIKIFGVKLNVYGIKLCLLSSFDLIEDINNPMSSKRNPPNRMFLWIHRFCVYQAI